MRRFMRRSLRERKHQVNALPTNNARLGRLGERLALCVYLLQGYSPISRPRTEHVQTDLLMRRGQTLVLVEVKTRRHSEPFAKVLGPAQKARLAKQAAFWAAKYPHMGVRLDVVHISLSKPFWQRWKNILAP
jgi:putative endonuclease